MDYYETSDIIAKGHEALDWLERKITGPRLSRLFWHTVRVKIYTPPYFRGNTVETYEPFRKATAHGIRVSPWHGLMFGFWTESGYDEETALLEATMMGRSRTDAERSAYDEDSVKNGGRVEGVDFGLVQGGSGLRDRATRDAGADVGGPDRGL